MFELTKSQGTSDTIAHHLTLGCITILGMSITTRTIKSNILLLVIR
jgi:hypothetical protein